MSIPAQLESRYPHPFGRSLELRRPPLCPEIHLWLIGDDIDLEADCRELRDGEGAPYWAFCWGAGQALARFLLDRPGEVAGLRVVDLGSGSGVVAIAAALAGARSVVAVDTDPAASRAVRTNALENGARIDTSDRVPDDWDVLLAADVLYEASMRDWLIELAAPERRVIVADPERTQAPRLGVEPFARFDARTFPDVDSPMRRAAVFELGV